jgi:hypothetical protein
MRLDQIAKLKAVVETAQPVTGSFVEYIDDDESYHVVTGVAKRETEESPVALLSSGGFVALADADACDFRLVQPAIPADCDGKPCERCESEKVTAAQPC